MTSISVRVAVLSAILLALPPEISGQAVSGRVRDATTGEGLRTAFVELLNAAEERVGAVLTGGDGRFRLNLTEGQSESVRVVINSLSHRGAAIDSVRVVEGQVTDLGDIYLQGAPIELPGVVAQGRRSRITLGREAVRRHQLLGPGTFLPGALIEAEGPGSLTAYIAQRSGLWVRYLDLGAGMLRNPTSSTGDPCIVVKVNRWPLNRPGIDPADPPIGFRDLDDIPLDWIAAIEIFNDYNDVPDLYDSDAIAGSSYCGIVNVWLWNSWN